ncbi:MAG: hypothetical protein E7441_01640 [Ruminococcaceae bacterium]|nr:hypothetical protein [Oscillospiraceae bacterium]
MEIRFTEKEQKDFRRMFNDFFEDRKNITQDFFDGLKEEAEKKNYEPLTTFIKNAGEIYKELEKTTREGLNSCASDIVPRELGRLSGGSEFEANFNKAFRGAIKPMDSSTVISLPVITSGEALMDKVIFDEIREKVKKYQESMRKSVDSLERYLKRYDRNTLSCLFEPIGRAVIYAHNDFCSAFNAKFGEFEGIYSRLPDHIQMGSTGQSGQNPFQLGSGNSQPNYQRDALPGATRRRGQGERPSAPDSNQNPNGQTPTSNADPRQGIEFKIEKFRTDILKLREGTVDDRFRALQSLTKSISNAVPSGSILTHQSGPDASKTADAYKYLIDNIAPFVVRESRATSRHEEWSNGPEGEKSTEELVKDITGKEKKELKFDDWKYYSQQKEALNKITETDFQKFGAVFALLKRNLAEGTVLSSGNFRFSRNDRSQWKNTGKDMGLLIVAMVRFSGLLLGDNVDCWWLDEYGTLKYEEEPVVATMDDERAAANARLLLEKYRREDASFKSLYKKAWDDFRFGISVGEKAIQAVSSLIRMGCLVVNPLGYVTVDVVLKAMEKSVEIASAAGNEGMAGIAKIGIESTGIAERIEDAIGDADKQVRDKVINLLRSKSLERIRNISDTLIAKDTKVSDAVKMAKEFMEPLVSEGLLQLSDVQVISDALDMISGVKETLSNCVAPAAEKIGRAVDKAKQFVSPATDWIDKKFVSPATDWIDKKVPDKDSIPNWMENWVREAPGKIRKHRGYEGSWDDVRAYLDMAGNEFRELDTCILDCRAKVSGWMQDTQLDVESAYLGVYIKEKKSGVVPPDKHMVAEKCRALLKSWGYEVDEDPLQTCLNKLD